MSQNVPKCPEMSRNVPFRPNVPNPAGDASDDRGQQKHDSCTCKCEPCGSGNRKRASAATDRLPQSRAALNSAANLCNSNTCRRRDRHAAASRAHLAALHTGGSPRESAALSVRSVGDAAAPRRATDSRSRRSRTLRPLRGGAQPRSLCPVCVSCRWPASRGCAAVCPRHSLP